MSWSQPSACWLLMWFGIMVTFCRLSGMERVIVMGESVALEVCSDCLMIVANDDGSGMSPVNEARVRLAVAMFPGQLVPGGPHAPDCTAMEDGTDCECEQFGFSQCECDLCRDGLAGDRFAVTGFVTRSAGV